MRAHLQLADVGGVCAPRGACGGLAPVAAAVHAAVLAVALRRNIVLLKWHRGEFNITLDLIQFG